MAEKDKVQEEILETELEQDEQDEQEDQKKSQRGRPKKEESNTPEPEPEQFNMERLMNTRFAIKNICPWAVSFRLQTTNGDVYLDAGKKTTLIGQEIITLCENSNVLFSGTGNGDHARIYIEDAEMRKYVGFETREAKQKILDDTRMDEILSFKTINTIQRNLEKYIVAEHEKHIFMDFCRKRKLNDFDKITAIEEHTGLKFRE